MNTQQKLLPIVKPPYLGAAYYPEAWPLEQIDTDIELMKQAGMNVMRIGEFAWSRMEPSENVFDFDWLHLVVDKLGAAGIAVIMCTPTPTPPKWLTQKYPVVVFQLENGRLMQHGMRRHACPNSPVYRDHCTRIVTKMAEEFGKDDRIIGWQIDNELYAMGPGHRSCQCPVCVNKFQESMKAKHGTIANLNEAWNTALWSQTYESFSQLPTPDTSTFHHPSLLTEWSNFTSDSYVDFARHQADILHKYTTQPVGTDMMPLMGVDHGDMHCFLDVAQFNHYDSVDTLWQAGFWFDYIRTLKDVPFWNTETQTCWNGATAANGYKEPGFCKANSWLPIAYGGEANLYWLWRQHRAGQELMHGAVVSSTGRPLHILEEVREIADGFAIAADFLNTTRPTSAKIALHYSQHSGRMFEYQPLVNNFVYLSSLMEKVYRPMIRAQLRLDVIHPMADLSSYKMIVSPFLISLDTQNLRERIKEWIENGGIWIVGPMSDVRNTHAAKFTHAPYGSLEEWAGIYCKYEIPADPRDFKMRWADDRETNGSVWYDGLELRGAEALATYTEGPFAGLAAITRKNMGKGQIIVLGTMPQPSDFQSLLLSIGKETGVLPVAKASENVLVVPRTGEGQDGMVVMEIEHKPGHIVLPNKMMDILTGKEHTGMLELEPYTVMVLKKY